MNQLEFKNISKSFSSVEVLHNITFSIEKGKLFALIGENGAGKSTLMKILSGVLNVYEGEIILNGKRVSFKNPREAEEVGIAIIHQELNLVSDLSIAENIFLGHEPKGRAGFIDFKKMYNEAEQILSDFGFPFSVNFKIRDIPLGWQQMVEIAKALRIKAEIIVMDEPTSALSESEIPILFKQIQILKNNGKTIIYISHRMKEIFKIADEAIVMRDGAFIGKYLIEEIDQPFLVKKMAGKEIVAVDTNQKINFESDILKLQNVSVFESNKKTLSEIDFALKRGEVLGVAGLLGAGRTELLKFIYAADNTQYKGSIKLFEKKYKPVSPKKSLQTRVVYLSEDRKTEGIFPELSIMNNSSISILNQFSQLGFIKEKEEKNSVLSKTNELNVRMKSIHQPINTLSGGNQQKVLISRLMLVNPELLLLDEPTRGIDVGAKQEIYNIINVLKTKGVGVLFTSSEIHELLLVADRILVLSGGKQAALLDKKKTNAEEILHFAFESVA